MKKLLQFLLGLVFLTVFTLLTLSSAVKFKLLTVQFWTTPLKQANTYTNLENKLKNEIKKQPALTMVAGGITAQVLEDFAQTNIRKIEEYLTGKTSKLLLYAPVDTLGISPEIIAQMGLSKLSRETDSQVFLSSFMPPSQATQIVSGIEQVRQWTMLLPTVLVVLLVVLVVLLVVYSLLAEGTAGRVKAVGRLFIVTGGQLALLGWGTKAAVEGLLDKNTQILPEVKEIVPKLVGDFFGLPLAWGLVMAAAGLVAVFIVNYFIKTEKIKGEKEQKKEVKTEGSKKWLWAGAAILVVIISVAFTTSKNGTQLIGKPYQSELGWSLRYPQGWTVKKQAQAIGFFKEDKKDWAFIAVEKAERPPQVDKGIFLFGLGQIFGNGQIERFPNSKLFGEPIEDQWQGWRRFSVAFDYDHSSGVKSRQKRLYLFPPKSGSGFLVYWETAVTNWDKYDPILEQAAATFSAQ
ncbi:hypothetical protein HYS97_03715 [Candidatus Daviesbacteria bacterium]|nr:hypothetical protein [Candidatus Daviesbacteria bacterium]